MVGILFLLLGSYQRGSGRTVMTIGNIQTWHLGELAGNGLHVCVIVYHPELVPESVDRSDEVVLWRCLGIPHNEIVEHLVVRIGEEYGFYVCIVHADVLHAVLLFVATCKFVLLDMALLVVVSMGADHQTILRLAFHGLGIYIIMFARVLHKPAFVLELLEVLSGFLVDTRVVLRSADGEVDFRFDDMVEAFFVVASLGTSLFAVQHIVWTAFYLLHQILWWTYSLEWFYNCHELLNNGDQTMGFTGFP